MTPTYNINDLRQALKIDTMDIDTSLMEQPGLYYQVADAHALAISERDSLKLDIEELTADLDERVRRTALEAEEKVTETQVQNRVRAFPEMRKLRRDLLDAAANVDAWQALKDAFSQRSFMLRELVATRLAELSTLSIERSAKARTSAVVHEAAGNERLARRNVRRG